MNINTMNIEEQFQNILEKYISEELSLQETYDWINNDLCGLLYRTRFGRSYLIDMTEDELHQYYSSYSIFEDYEKIDINDLQILKHSLLEQLSYFTPEELNQLI